MQYNRPGEVMRVILPVASLLCRPLYNCIPTFGLSTPSINSPTPCPRQLLATTVPLVPPLSVPIPLEPAVLRGGETPALRSPRRLAWT